MQTLDARADVIVRDSAGGPVAVIEVNNREGLTPEIAAQLRRNMASHGLIGRAPYFLLVSQDVGYLWREGPDSPIDAPPAVQFPMGSVVERYAVGVLNGKRLRGLVLKPLVVHWLSELSARRQGDLHDEAERLLAEAGLLDALRDATIEPHAVV